MLHHIVLAQHNLHNISHFVEDIHFSDHHLIGLVWQRVVSNPQSHKVISFRKLEHIDSHCFNTLLQSLNWEPFISSNDVNFKWSFIKDAIFKALDTLAPLTTVRIKSKTRHKPWINNQILKDMNTRDKLYKNFKLTKDASLWNDFLSLKNKVNSSIKRAKFYYFRKTLTTNDSKHIWSVVKSWNKSCRTDTQKITPDILAKHYSDYPKKLHQAFNNPPDFSSFLGSPAHQNFCFDDFSLFDLSTCIHALNCSKSAGSDGINNFVLKSACPFILSHILNLFNCCLHTSSIPDEWKVAVIRPIFKKGSKSDPKNYRPISLLSSTSKVFEKLLHNQMINYLDKQCYINPSQHGFRQGFSTNTAVSSLTDFIFKSFDSKKSVPAVFLDLSTAFDCVDHTILTEKLKHYGFRDRSLSLLSFYLHERKFQVRTDDGKLSDTYCFFVECLRDPSLDRCSSSFI